VALRAVLVSLRVTDLTLQVCGVSTVVDVRRQRIVTLLAAHGILHVEAIIVFRTIPVQARTAVTSLAMHRVGHVVNVGAIAGVGSGIFGSDPAPVTGNALVVHVGGPPNVVTLYESAAHRLRPTNVTGSARGMALVALRVEIRLHLRIRANRLTGARLKESVIAFDGGVQAVLDFRRDVLMAHGTLIDGNLGRIGNQTLVSFIFRELAGVPAVTDPTVKSVWAVAEGFIAGSCEDDLFPSLQRRDRATSAFTRRISRRSGIRRGHGTQHGFVGMAADAIGAVGFSRGRGGIVLICASPEEQRKDEQCQQRHPHGDCFHRRHLWIPRSIFRQGCVNRVRLVKNHTFKDTLNNESQSQL
jgi:hypothetical protein